MYGVPHFLEERGQVRRGYFVAGLGAAQFATPEGINFMAREGRGLICLALTGDRCDELGLDLMAAKNESTFETAFTVSVVCSPT